MNRLLDVYVTTKVTLILEDSMSDQEAVDEFFNTNVNFEETENLEIKEVEIMSVDTDPEEDYDTNYDEDIDDEMYRMH